MTAMVALLEDNLKPLQENFETYYNKIIKNIESFELKSNLSEKELLLKNSHKILVYLEKCV